MRIDGDIQSMLGCTYTLAGEAAFRLSGLRQGFPVCPIGG